MSELKPAPSGYPIKLVRDGTPEVVNKSGERGDLFYGPVDPAEFTAWLRRKLGEEVAEYLVSPGEEELADVLAVVEGLAMRHGLTLYELGQMVENDARGGFSSGMMMFGLHSEFDGVAEPEEERGNG